MEESTNILSMILDFMSDRSDVTLIVVLLILAVVVLLGGRILLRHLRLKQNKVQQKSDDNPLA